MGAVTTTVYPSLLPKQIEFIFNDSESKLIFVEDILQLEKIKSIISNCPKLKTIIVMNNTAENEENYIKNLNTFLVVDKEDINDSNVTFKDMIYKSNEDDLVKPIKPNLLDE